MKRTSITFSKNTKANLSKAERNALRLMEHVLQDMYGDQL